MEIEKEDVTLSQERYAELLHAECKLIALEHAGVDNWEGYGDAMEALDEEE